jgi:hypothetical protein
MTDAQAESLIRELRLVRGAILVIAVILALFVGLRISDDLLRPNPAAGVQTELSAIHSELILLRGEVQRSHSQNVSLPIPVPQAKPPGGAEK